MRSLPINRKPRELNQKSQTSNDIASTPIVLFVPPDLLLPCNTIPVQRDDQFLSYPPLTAFSAGVWCERRSSEMDCTWTNTSPATPPPPESYKHACYNRDSGRVKIMARKHLSRYYRDWIGNMPGPGQIVGRRM